MTGTRFGFHDPEGLLIGGHFLHTKETLTSVNPTTLEPLGRVCVAGKKQVEEATALALSAFRHWAKTPPETRSAHFRRAREILVNWAEDVARLIAQEQGKPVVEALTVEVLPALGTLLFLEKEAPRILQERPIRFFELLFADKKGYFRFEPKGPVLVISPWNYPFLLPLSAVAFALAAGNTVVLKPSPITPLTGALVGRLFHEAGFPPGTIAVLQGGPGVGQALVERPEFRLIHFTGSTETGRKIMASAAPHLTPLILELGGKDPMIVFADANLERAAAGAVWAAFMNAGQTCSSVERVFVERPLFDAFVEQVVTLTQALKVGDPLDPDTEVGPITAEFQLRKVEDQVEEAQKKGARVLTGGRRLTEFPGYFYPPTILTQVHLEMRVMEEETFGPLMPIMPFDSEEEVMAWANRSPYGLTASIWTSDLERARRIAAQIQAGVVTVNDHTFSFGEPRATWGGVKASGFGRSRGEFGLLEMTDVKFVGIDPGQRSRPLWWYPYDQTLLSVVRKAPQAFHATDTGQRLQALLHLVRRHWGKLFRELPLPQIALRAWELLER